jgi:hypothetical protein
VFELNEARQIFEKDQGPRWDKFTKKPRVENLVIVFLLVIYFPAESPMALCASWLKKLATFQPNSLVQLARNGTEYIEIILHNLPWSFLVQYPMDAQKI